MDGVAEVVNGSGSAGSRGAELMGVYSGGIGSGLFCAEGAGGCAAAAEMLEEQATAAHLVAEMVAVTCWMASAAQAKGSEEAAATPAPTRAGRLIVQTAAEDCKAPKPLNGPTRKKWSRWTGHGVVLMSRQMKCGSSAVLETLCYCSLQFHGFGRCSDEQSMVWRMGLQHRWEG